MNIDKINKLFNRLLKEYNCYQYYMENINLYNKNNYVNNIPQGKIIYAFNWRKTKQGWSFWNNINHLWIKILKQNGYL